MFLQKRQLHVTQDLTLCVVHSMKRYGHISYAFLKYTYCPDIIPVCGRDHIVHNGLIMQNIRRHFTALLFHLPIHISQTHWDCAKDPFKGSSVVVLLLLCTKKFINTG
jgi:hypothetical protein